MPLLLLLWPVLEIWFYARVCAAIGVGDTLLLSLLTIAAGSWLIQRQNLSGLMADGSLSRRGFTGAEGSLFGRICLTLAGILLILPGFLSDFAALVLIAPGGRAWVRRQLHKGLGGRAFAMSGFHATRQDHSPYARRDSGPNADIIEGDYERLDDQDAD
jgi:UPF0716 protein FxsA